MALHLTSRIGFMDSGNQGKVCHDPCGNSFCVASRSVAGALVARLRNLSIEQMEGVRGQPFEVAKRLHGYVPPCSAYANVHGSMAIPHMHNPPEFLSEHTDPSLDVIPPFSAYTWPFYEALSRERGSVGGWAPANVRQERVTAFVESLEPQVSMVVHYYNHDNRYNNLRAARDRATYLVESVSKLTFVGMFERGEQVPLGTLRPWPNLDPQKARVYGDQIWAFGYTHDPDVAVRMPYAEVLALEDGERKLEEILVRVPGAFAGSFSYVANRLSDDRMVSLLGLMIAKLSIWGSRHRMG